MRLLAVIFTLFLISSNSWGCNLTGGPSDVSVAWSPTFTSLAVTFTVTNTDILGCNMYFGFSKGSASSYASRAGTQGSNTLNYQLYKDSSLSTILKSKLDTSGSTNIISASYPLISTPVSQTFTYYIQVPLDLATTPNYKLYGTYTDTFTIEAFDLVLGLTYFTKNVTITFTVPQIIEMAFYNGSGFNSSFVNNTLNLGDLTSSASGTVDFLVRSNAGYNVYISSANNSKLAHTTNASASKIPYLMSINGSNSPITTAPSLKFSSSSVTGTGGDFKEIKFQTTAAPGGVSGTYQDVITISAITTQ